VTKRTTRGKHTGASFTSGGKGLERGLGIKTKTYSPVNRTKLGTKKTGNGIKKDGISSRRIR
jgi:hypothetical protein